MVEEKEEKKIEVPQINTQSKLRKVVIETDGRIVKVTQNECTVLELREIGRQLTTLS